ncbi:MAG: CRISPR-associated endonuclease Cas2 [Limisphaerales bacterium]
MSEEPNNPSDEGELLPDERPHRSRNEKTDAAGIEWEKSSLQSNAPFQLQPLTAADSPLRRRSRGKRGRDPVCSKYRMAWVLVFFDLPVGTPEERKAANNFRKDLIHDGYMMVQFSVYARPCGTADRVETQVRRLKSKIPSKGEVRGLMISDAQWGRMIVMRSRQIAEAEKMPAQMQFF